MADGLLQPRIGGLYHGVSRQAPLQRAPNQMEELDNWLPSVDLSAVVDRDGTLAITALDTLNYAAGGHHFFRTTDGQRWVLLRRVETGTIEVRNLLNGALASLTYGAYVQNYIGATTSQLKFLTLSDTTFILNPDVVVGFAPIPKPELTQAYVVIRKLSTAAQSFNVATSVGAGSFVMAQGAGGIITRDFAALQLAQNCGANMPGVTVFRVAGNVIRFSGPAAVIASLVGSNDWDETAMTVIKGRVTALTDLPPVFESNAPILVDLGFADGSTAYYVSYDAALNAWVECSYLPNRAVTADLHEGSMPIKLRQLGTNSFTLEPIDWVPRKVGDDESNPPPPFVGKRITAMTEWKGRLWLGASDGSIIGSQPDDLFNFFRESAREVKPADPVVFPTGTKDLASVNHLVAFRTKLMVMSDTAQLEVDPGQNPVKPDIAPPAVATRYSLDKECEPSVVGDVLFYTGVAENRAVLWEYSYSEATANNTATDLSKHVPGYVPGAVRRIAGSATAGRTYLWSANDPGRLYVNTGYWKDGQRSQNAWSRLSFPGVTVIRHHWVSEDKLFLLAVRAGVLWLLSVDVDANIGDLSGNHLRLEFRQLAQITWNVARNRSEVVLPLGYPNLSSLLLVVGDGVRFRGYPLTVAWDGSQWIGHFATNTGQLYGFLGTRFDRTATFSPFYPSLGESTTPVGRLQVRKVVVDALVSGDFTSTVQRDDRVTLKEQKSPRVIGEALVPDVGYNVQHRLSFNSKGDAATLSISTDSFAPMALSGFTLLGRYTNPTAP